MATYVYETIPAKSGGKTKTFEIQQSMKDPALTKHPETGEPIRRVITGGLGIVTKGVPKPLPAAHRCGGAGCGCRH